MKTGIAVAFCCGALCALPAFSQTPASGTDQEFINTAGQIDMTEAHIGQMAQDQGATQGVKDFGQMLVTDHTADYSQLTAAATKAGATVPKGIDKEHDRMIAPLNKLKAAAFDRKFVHDMVAGHEKAIAAYQREAKDGQNADMKAYATQALPTLQKHLQTARDLEKGKHGA